MKLSEYLDNELIEEIRYRGLEIKIIQSNIYQASADKPNIISIGDVKFVI